MTHRFSFGPGADLLRHAKSVRVELSLFRGELAIQYRVEGHIIPGMEDEDDEDAAVLDAPDPEQLAGDILSAFIANTRKGGPR